MITTTWYWYVAPKPYDGNIRSIRRFTGMQAAQTYATALHDAGKAYYWMESVGNVDDIHNSLLRTAVTCAACHSCPCVCDSAYVMFALECEHNMRAPASIITPGADGTKIRCKECDELSLIMGILNADGNLPTRVSVRLDCGHQLHDCAPELHPIGKVFYCERCASYARAEAIIG